MFYVFDALVIFLAFIAYSVPLIHYGRCLGALADLFASGEVVVVDGLAKPFPQFGLQPLQQEMPV